MDTDKHKVPWENHKQLWRRWWKFMQRFYFICYVAKQWPNCILVGEIRFPLTWRRNNRIFEPWSITCETHLSSSLVCTENWELLWCQLSHHWWHWGITMTSQWARWRLKSPASRLFTKPFIQTQIKENIKAPRHWPLCGEFTADRWIPRTMASNAENDSIWWRNHVQLSVFSMYTDWPLNKVVGSLQTIFSKHFLERNFCVLR